MRERGQSREADFKNGRRWGGVGMRGGGQKSRERESFNSGEKS